MFIVGGYPGRISIFTSQLLIAQVLDATFFILSSISFLFFWSVDLSVPPIVTVSGITLNADPPSIFVIDKTALLKGSNCLDIKLWSAVIVNPAATIGSFAYWGCAACPPLPFTSITIISPPAIAKPSWITASPTGIPGQLWIPQTLSILNFLKRPSSIIALAPALPPSSAGWKTQYTFP